MNEYGIATSIGVIIVLLLAYIMHPLNAGAISILSVIIIGGANGIAAIFKKGKENKGG